MTDTLIKGEMTVKADTNIKSNVSGKNIYETNGNLTVDDANMKFTENIVNRNKDSCLSRNSLFTERAGI